MCVVVGDNYGKDLWGQWSMVGAGIFGNGAINDAAGKRYGRDVFPPLLYA